MKKITAVITAILATFIMLFSSGCLLDDFRVSTPTIVTAQDVKINSIEEGERALLSRVQAVNQVKRSVVAIKAKNGNVNSASSGVIVDIDRFDEENQLLDADNEFFIVTCCHCIDGASNITIYVPDANGKNYTDEGYNSSYMFTGTIGGNPQSAGSVSLVGGDRDSDLAILRLVISDSTIASNIVEAKVMDTTKNSLEVGEDVFSVGNPGGSLPGAVSAGIVSYLLREENVENAGRMQLMQIDVQTNKGNSGGGLFNHYGELVGITSAGDLTLDGVNFAIPLVTNTPTQGIISVISQLASTATATNYGYVTGVWRLGIQVEEDISELKIVGVDTYGIAYAAGLRANTVITGITIGTQPYAINNMSTFYSAMRTAKESLVIGNTIKVEVNSIYSRTITLKQFILCDTGVTA